MNLYDLKLFVDVAWENRNGQKEVLVPSGFLAARGRLVKAGLLWTTSSPLFVYPSTRGEEALAEMCRILEKRKP